MELYVNILEMDIRFYNRVIYDRQTCDEIVLQANEKIKEKKLIGELGYEGRSDIILNNVSHMIKSVNFNEETNCVEGTIEILDTPKGREILRMIDNNPEKFNEMFCVRPRGTGIVQEDGRVENYKLYSFDIILNEPKAFFF